MLLQGHIRNYLKQHPDKSFTKKPKNRMLLAVVKRLNNDCQLRHFYSHWARTILDEHDVPRESDHSWHYVAYIEFSDRHIPLVKITDSRNPQTGRITYKITGMLKPAIWTVKHAKTVRSIADWNNKRYHLGERRHIVATKPLSLPGFSEPYFVTGDPDNEPGHSYRFDTHLIENYCADLIKTEIMVHNIGIIKGWSKARKW